MAPRTRATTSTAPATLAAAPRRRLKITPLDSDETKQPAKKTDLTARPATRSTRSNSVTASEPIIAAPSKTTTAKPRGRPKKSESIIEEPKRVTRSTRATSTTASSEAKEKPAARSRKTTAKEETTFSTVQNVEPVSKQDEKPQAATIVRKRVTFQDIVEDDKENQPLTRAAKKTAASKASAPTGLRAKPVRKPATASTRSTKRSKEPTSDDEEENNPRKIQRVLTPKKVTQVARAATPDEPSDDELNSAKTPVRDLSLSPKRPQSTKTSAAVARNISPVKSLDFSQSLHSAQHANVVATENALASPAKRPSSPTKIFTHSTNKSPVKAFNDELSTSLASPAKRPAVSPAKEGLESSKSKTNGDASKLLFPHSNRRDHLTSSIQSSVTTNLLQSPKRPVAFDPSRIFAQSAVKLRSKDLSKSNFFSSPAKRHGLLSPLKQSIASSNTEAPAYLEIQSLNELDLNEMEVTNLLEDGMVETTVTSYQRPSASPLRPITLFEDILEDELDNSILPVRSPMKISKSPQKAPAVEAIIPLSEDVDVDEDITEAISSVQPSPYEKATADKSFVSLRVVEDGVGEKLKDVNVDFTMTDVDDETIILPENMLATPRNANIALHDISQDELAISAGEDMIAKFIRIPGNTPRTPATLNEHELTQMLSSPDSQSGDAALTEGTPCTIRISSPILEDGLHQGVDTGLYMDAEAEVEADVSGVPAVMDEGESSRLIFPTIRKSVQSPASLHEHEMTLMGGVNQSPADQKSPASIGEHELTMMAGRGGTETPSSPINGQQDEIPQEFNSSPPQAPSPTFTIDEHELTRIGESSEEQEKIIETKQAPAMASSKPSTPSVPILRKFNINTVVTKIPLKPEGQESPIKLNIKKRKRPFSLGGNPDTDLKDIFARPGSVKVARTQNVASPSQLTPTMTPASNISNRTITMSNARRTVSAPVPRSPLAAVIPSNDDVLHGVVVYVDVRTSEGADASAIYIDLLTNLGATILKDWRDTPPTHVIYKDGRPKTLEKVRVAAADGLDLKCVGVSWPLDCEAQQTWLDESSYLLKLTSSEQILGSVNKSARRKSMEPSMLITDGAGSVKRSRSRSRLSMGSRKSLAAPESTPSAIRDHNAIVGGGDELATPVANAAKRHADTEKLSLTAAWKSINATQNLGEDTPARKMLDLLQRSYAAEQEWDSTILSAGEGDENTPLQITAALTSVSAINGEEDGNDNDNDVSAMVITETGLTPAPYRTKQQVGSAPGKVNGAGGFMSYRERVEEMERREMRDGARGVKGGQRGRDGRRVTIFGN